MKQYIHAFAMCQSMFCAIPCPWRIWDEKARDKMLLMLPVVGLEIGLIWAGLAWLMHYLGLPELIRGLVLCVYPFLITGCIHLDGFMDVSDAVGSCRDLERRREILKDSHVGAFAVISVCILLLAQFAFLSSGEGAYGTLALLCAVSRCCCALAVMVLKPMQTSQYAAQERPGSYIAAVIVMLALFLGAGVLLLGKYVLALIACMIGCGFSLQRGYRSLGGMNGDISGYALTIGELCGVAVYALI